MYSKVKPWVIGLTMAASFTGAAHCQADEPPHIELQRRRCRGSLVRRHHKASGGMDGDDSVNDNDVIDNADDQVDDTVSVGALVPVMA